MPFEQTGLPGLFPRMISADASVILATFKDNGEDDFLLWTADTGFIDPGFPDAHDSDRAILSDDGNVVIGGHSQSSVGGSRPWRWTKETGAVDIEPPPNAMGAIPQGVSADGSVIVFADRPGGFTLGSPFIWDSVHGSRWLVEVLTDEHDLGDALAGWSLLVPWRISGDGGSIVGSGINPDGNREAWIAFLGPPAPPLSGDYNGDGRVDAADYVVWRKGLATGAFAQNDYNTWRSNFGASAAGAAAVTRSPSHSAVPEPNTLALAALALAAISWRRRGTATGAWTYAAWR